MHLLSVLAGVCLLTLASCQTTTPPPHKLFAPQDYHVGSVESFTLTSYDSSRFPVTATVSYQECSCDSNRRRICKGEHVTFHETSGLTRQGRPVQLDVQMPSISQLVGRRFFIAITSHDGEVSYLSQRQLSFNSNSLGFLLVKTDKPIYKPSQDVNFCIVFLDPSLRPHGEDNQVRILIRDSKFKQILNMDPVTIPAGDIKCLDFPLAEEPNFGTWSISVFFKAPQERGGCQPFYSAHSASCSFKVDEFVLPRFEVSLGAPNQLEREETIELTVRAQYVFGEPVQGNVKVNATLESSTRRESLPFHDRTITLRNGVGVMSIPAERYQSMVRYRYDPFCVRSSIKVTAEVEEAGRGTKIAETATIPLVFAPIDVEFADNNPKMFRPGLNYTLKAKASLGDGSPADGVGVAVKVTANNGEVVLFDHVITSVAGAVETVIPVPLDTNCMKITLEPAGSVAGSCVSESECFSPSPVFSPTKSFLQLTDVSVISPRPNSKVDIQATSTVPFTYLHLLVIGQGRIQDHVFNIRRGGVTSAQVSFRVTYEMSPRVKVLGLFAREDGELVADLIELEVDCDLKNDVEFSFSGDIVEPGDPVSMTTVTEAGSVVLVSVVDKSLTLLAEACKSLEKDNVCRMLRSLTGGSLTGGASCDVGTEGRCCPESCSEPTVIGVNNILNAAGVRVHSNMFRPSPPVTPRPITPPVLPDGIFFDGPLFDGPSGPVAPPTSPPSEEEEARVFFPESWVFQIAKANSEGHAVINSAAPDTITTWFGEAFSLSRGAGLGVSRMAQITVSKPFFVSLELPFSINFGESVEITPLVFFFGLRASTVASISVTVDDDLDLRELSLGGSGQLNVERGEGAPFSFKLHPRAIGKLDVTISATSDRGERDTVRKTLFVKPGCERFELTENVFAEGEGRHCFNYSLPSCVIPGSAAANIAVTGDLMSPPDLDRLLVLPSGCGEQNLVRTAVNWVVAEYLTATRQLDDFIQVKITNNIMRGYQRQLNYLQGSGCFSIWPTTSCSLWLTASVVDVFSGVVNYYEREEPGTQLIDMSVVNGAINYIIARQSKETGEFPIIGRVHSSILFRSAGSVSHTAFVVLALKQYLQSFPESGNSVRVRDAITKAESYIIDQRNNGVEFCNYGLALSAYALHKNVPSSRNAVKRRIVATLKERITSSKIYPGACFVCHDCPSDTRSDGPPTMDCGGRPRSEGSAYCVETTAYTLLALREAEDTQFTVCLAQWLIRIRGSSGGFYSSQDTVVAMKALAGFAMDTFTKELDMTLAFSLSGTAQLPLTISTENRYERNTVNVASLPSNGNCVNWSGSGTAIIQSTLTYYGCDCCSEERAFSLELATQLTTNPLGTILSLEIRIIRYLGFEESSDMAIVDVEMPSGYVFSHHQLANEIGGAELERSETRGTSVVFYFNNVPTSVFSSFTLFFSRSFIVDTPQQTPVTIYNYYDPGQSVTQYYLPVDGGSLPPLPDRLTDREPSPGPV